MTISKIGVIGMCERDCVHSEGIVLSDGNKLNVNRCPSGKACIQVGALAARYTQAELATIGCGDDQRGIIEVAKVIYENPTIIVHNAVRPYHTLTIGE